MKDNRSIESKIVKTEPVKWKALEILQTKDLKEMSKESYGRLKTSLIDNSFVQTLNVWANNGKLYCFDGYHRIKVMMELEKEGYTVPEELPANFIACRNRKEASKLVLIYSAIYANVTGEGLYEFMNSEGLELNDIKFDVELPEIDFEKFEKEFFEEKEQGGNGGGMVPEKDPNIIARISFHPGMWLGKREEILNVFEKMKKSYECQVKIEE